MKKRFVIWVRYSFPNSNMTKYILAKDENDAIQIFHVCYGNDAIVLSCEEEY